MEKVRPGMESPSPRPRARRKRLLTEAMIIEAALAVVDETGELTMSTLASRVGSTASSIYHHFRNRAAIIEGLRDHVGSQISPLDDSLPWDRALPRFLRSYRDVFARHPRLIPLLTSQPISSDNPVRAYDGLAAMLGRHGFPTAEHLLWLTVLDNFVLGSALDLAAPEEIWHSAGDATPALEAAIRAAPSGRARADASFELGVAALMAGMKARLEQVPRS